MSDHLKLASEAGPVEVILEGRSELPSAYHTDRSAIAERKLKIAYRGGYDHFELVSEPHDTAPAVFRWTMHTKIAE